MSFTTDVLNQTRPDSLNNIASRPERQHSFASPVDWRDQVLYFLLVDRFSDGREDTRPLLNKANLEAARPT